MMGGLKGYGEKGGEGQRTEEEEGEGGCFETRASINIRSSYHVSTLSRFI